MNCPRCGAEVSGSPRFCPDCGLSLEAAGHTLAMDEAVPSRPSGISRPASSSSALDGDDLTPGTLVDGRYRIVGLLGRGGMGEVYRADDLKVGQSVALKFLPTAFARDEKRVARFYQEVRLARQVSHPNVCRVYDVGEVEDRIFLSMEYVDGEDLSSLLRRIGRLPQEKAVDIARQLCAGLNALHDRDVLHRDLKPSNVMLDGRGRVRITDFGLAGVADQIEAGDLRSGTPAYMAPEQLDGKEVSVRSDIYSLGLVLHEIFTGKPVFSADSLPELMRLHATSTPSRLSSHVSDVDPAVESIVARCLEKDPARRPASALLVSVALPGGDPLAAALAAGETPSPELVAAAGGEGGLHPAVALLCLAGFVLGLLLYAGVGINRPLYRFVDFPKPAAALKDRMQELVADLGLPAEPADTAHGFGRLGSVMRHVEATDSTAGRWERLRGHRPSPVVYWYRQSPRPLLPEDKTQRADWSDPPLTLAGMVRILTEPDGRLVELQAVPPESLSTAVDSTALEAAWDRLFEAADLRRDDFAPVEPAWVPFFYTQDRLAWHGHYPDDEESEVEVVAGHVGARPVYFEVRGPWTEATRTVEGASGNHPAQILIVALVLLVLSGSVALARRNHRAGTADVKGASRLAFFLILTALVQTLLLAPGLTRSNEFFDRFFPPLSVGLLFAAFCWTLYLALEPFVRRTWPDTLIAWTRLLGGRLRDPLVGRSVLVGGAVFGLTALIGALSSRLLLALGEPPGAPTPFDFSSLLSARFYVGSLLDLLPGSLFNSLFFLVLLVLLRMLTHRRWASAVGFLAVVLLVSVADSPHWAVGLFSGLALGALWLVTLLRFGLLAFLVGFTLPRIARSLPWTSTSPSPTEAPRPWASS